jgi:RNA polymerase sigma-70 factor (ECF subfamily)
VYLIFVAGATVAQILDERATCMPGSRSRAPLTVVKGAFTREGASGCRQHGSGGRPPADRDLEWSILMARAQDGDSGAYRRLLEEMTPYLRSLAALRHRDPSDAEDAVQDILLTIHAVRQTYDPARPFRPWLVTIANRRLVDRLRRQGRLRSRETALTSDHATFPARQANLDEEISYRRELKAALDTLPAGQRQAIRLLKLKEMSLKDAAAATGLSVTALKGATHRALKSLRKMLSHPSEGP